jgi:hypothetical protein
MHGTTNPKLCACYRVKILSLSPRRVIFLKMSIRGGGRQVREKDKWFVETNPEVIADLEVRKYLNVCMVNGRVTSIANKLPDWTTTEWLWRVSFWMTIWVIDFIVRVSGWLNDRVSPWLNIVPHWKRMADRPNDWVIKLLTEWRSDFFYTHQSGCCYHSDVL